MRKNILQNLSDKELLSKTKGLRKEEKKLTSLVLEHLQEVENRKLYCELGINSLFSYCVKELDYSSAEASMRVNAVRLVSRHPNIKEKIDNGVLSLTSASLAQGFFREQGTDIHEQKEILSKIEGISTRQTKELLENKMSDKNLEEYKNRNQLKLNINGRLLIKIKKVQSDFGDCSELTVIEALLDQYLTAKAVQKAQRIRTSPPQNQRAITRSVKEKIYSRAQARCEYISPLNGKRCDGRTNLQWDHIRPIALGGNSEYSNIRLLCFSCNQRHRLKLGLARPRSTVQMPSQKT